MAIGYVVAGSGVKFGASGGALVTLLNVDNVKFSGGAKGQIDVTAISDTAKKFLDDVPDFGSMNFKLFWDPADAVHQGIFTSFKTAGQTDSWGIYPSNTGTIGDTTFSGSVVGWSWDYSKGGAVGVDVTVKLTGAVTVSIV